MVSRGSLLLKDDPVHIVHLNTYMTDVINTLETLHDGKLHARFSYDDNGRIIRKDYCGVMMKYSTSMTYDECGNLIKQESPGDYVTEYLYTNNHLSKSISSVNGVISKIVRYNSCGSMTERILYRDGVIIRYINRIYDDTNKLQYMIDSRYGSKNYVYNENGNLILEYKSDPYNIDTEKINYAWDGNGNLSKIVRISYGREKLIAKCAYKNNKLTQIIYGDGKVTKFQYNVDGTLKQCIEEELRSNAIRQINDFDKYGKIIRCTDYDIEAAKEISRFEYDYEFIETL